VESKIYNQKGEEAGKVTLPDAIFGLPWNGDLVHQVILAMRANARTPIAHTKDRGEVSGGGKKPWRQKGTGRARHGSIRSPLWVGGGVTHGPTNLKDYSQKLNKQMKTKALLTVLSKKMKDGEILFVEGFSLKNPKTKEAKSILESLSTIKGYENLITKKKNATLIATNGKESLLPRAFGNINNIAVEELRNINPLMALNFKYILIEKPEESFGILAGRTGVKVSKK